MVKKRIISTIATMALGLSLIGVANADTLDNLLPSKIMGSMQSKFNVSQQETNTNKQNMPGSITVKDQTKAEVKVSTEGTEKNNQNIVRMNPNDMANQSQMMINQSEMQKGMVEIHEGNYEKMLEIHESMPHNKMHGDFESQGAAKSDTTREQMGPQMGNAGMNRQMMGR